jgi:hypothetical protein
MSWDLLDTFDEAKRIRSVVDARALPPGVVDYGLSFGEDATGDPSVTVWLVVEDDSNPTDEQMKPVVKFVRSLKDALLEARLRHWPYVRFVHRSEAGRYLTRE